MVELIHEIAHLVFKGCNLAVALSKLLLLALQIKCFLVDKTVKLLNLIQSL